MSGSAIYEGWVTHRRRAPIEHSFRYRIFMPLFDLDELPELLDGVPLWSARRPAPARFRRSDYLIAGDPSLPLAEAARELVAAQAGFRPQGPVKLLANPRYWGLGFNPAAFYFLYGSGNTVEAMIADVTNTPWGESKAYVLRAGAGGLSGSFDKQLHVSPFMPMEQRYEWVSSEPGERLTISICNRERDAEVFSAAISMRRSELTPRRLARLLFAYPPMTGSTVARIYWNALKLKLKGAPYHSPPGAEPGATGCPR